MWGIQQPEHSYHFSIEFKTFWAFCSYFTADLIVSVQVSGESERMFTCFMFFCVSVQNIWFIFMPVHISLAPRGGESRLQMYQIYICRIVNGVVASEAQQRVLSCIRWWITNIFNQAWVSICSSWHFCGVFCHNSQINTLWFWPLLFHSLVSVCITWRWHRTIKSTTSEYPCRRYTGLTVNACWSFILSFTLWKKWKSTI